MQSSPAYCCFSATKYRRTNPIGYLTIKTVICVFLCIALLLYKVTLPRRVAERREVKKMGEKIVRVFNVTLSTRKLKYRVVEALCTNVHDATTFHCPCVRLHMSCLLIECNHISEPGPSGFLIHNMHSCGI